MTLDTRPMTHAERGRRGMRSRWGPQRVLRLDSLDAVTREIVTAIIEARANAAKASEPSGEK